MAQRRGQTPARRAPVTPVAPSSQGGTLANQSPPSIVNGTPMDTGSSTVGDDRTMQVVRRFYQARVQTTDNSFYNLNLAQVQALPGYPRICQVSVDQFLYFRKVYPFLYHDNSQVLYIEYDYVATRQGQEVYRQKVLQQANGTFGAYTVWTGNGVQKAWFSNILNELGSAGANGENLRVQNVNGSIWWMCPWLLNLTCDTFYIEVVNITLQAASPLFTGYMRVQSNIGV